MKGERCQMYSSLIRVQLSFCPSLPLWCAHVGAAALVGAALLQFALSFFFFFKYVLASAKNSKRIKKAE